MASAYPAGLDTFATNKANATATVTDHPAHHNDLADAVNKIEAELGINPSGASATVVARLDAAALFADANSTPVAVNSVSDVSVFSTNVASISAGDLIQVDIWGFVLNSTGGNRTMVFTLDFDAAFDMEWTMTSISQAQGWRMHAQLAVHASNLATLDLVGLPTAQITAGAMESISSAGEASGGYDTTTQNLTGTTAVTLAVRSSDAATTQQITVNGVIIRKVAST